MQTPAERQQINTFLGRAGFPQLDEPGALMAALAYSIADDNHFRSLLTRCEPEHRPAMYNSLTPNLRFTPKPLDVYLAKAASEAERKQLPVLAPGGALLPFKPVDIESPEYVAKMAWKREHAKFRLTLKCSRCTITEDFYGIQKADAIYDARNIGWAYDEVNGQGREICPKCVAN